MSLDGSGSSIPIVLNSMHRAGEAYKLITLNGKERQDAHEGGADAGDAG